ncbi:salt tolerance-like protein [Pyrus ussuriensis x Pyrus communis]|uniref:Salt tolerance-like protein n=1 Tax=Pyrus ussuriensis x Pyrus communis TaxID=2448454 RepID=A0A5N5HJY6_9ROSA|nr:salt tolerance-like protein [Pyrus ussuriensis x Pyrus communis]
MKIQCNICEAAEANVLCCANDVHKVKKLASKHQRVPLSSSHQTRPRPSATREAVGYFFCLEDRPLLCRKCDVAVHTANSFVSTHRRFLLNGIKVGHELAQPDSGNSDGVVVGVGVSYSIVKSRSGFGSVSRCETQNLLPVECKAALPARTVPQCYIDEFLGLSNLDQSFGYIDNGSSKKNTKRYGRKSPKIKQTPKQLMTQTRKESFLTWETRLLPSTPVLGSIYLLENSLRNSDGKTISADFICETGMNGSMENYEIWT